MIINSVTEIFFSPTNTTRKIITAISNGMGLSNKEAIDITKPGDRCNVNYEIKGDIAIIGVPVYEEKVPKIVFEFLMKLHGNNVPVIIVGVYGNMAEGIVLNELKTITENTGFKVVAAATFVGEHSFSSNKVPLAQNYPNEKELKEAEKFGQDIMIKMHKLKELNDIKLDIPQGKLLFMAKAAPKNSARLITKRPDVDESMCINCNICASWCPVGAINKETLKIDEDKCIRCFSCVKRCPKKARKIDYRPEFIVSKVFAMKNRVVNKPQIYL